jgi:hypothetical protein
LTRAARLSSSSFIASLISSRVRSNSVSANSRCSASGMALTVQATEQPNQKNNRQRNADKPKQQSASHNVYSYFALHKLNPTTTLALNRSNQNRSRVFGHFSSVARFKVVVDLITRTQPSKPKELTIEAVRYGSEKNRRPIMRCALCHLIIDSRTAWRSSTNRFYCSEFCADSEVSVPFEQCAQKEVHDRQYLERLRRLLPLFQDLRSNRISPRSVGALQ